MTHAPFHNHSADGQSRDVGGLDAQGRDVQSRDVQGADIQRADIQRADIQRYRVCRLGPLFYAVAEDAVRAVMFAHRGLEGNVPLHGERFPVLEPRTLFELPPAADLECQALLIGRTKPVAALLVDAVEERSVDVDTRRFQDLPWHFSGRERLWFDGVAAVGSKVLIRLHPEGLLVSYRAQKSLEAEGIGP